MIKSVDVQPEYANIRDKLVASSIGEGPESARSNNLDKFRAWLLYKSGALFVEAPSFVRVQCLSFSDDVADDLGQDAGEVSDDSGKLSDERIIAQWYFPKR